MRALRMIMATVVGCLCLCTASAQTTETIDRILEKSKTERVTLNYTCSISELSPLTIRGKLIIQGDCYFAEGYGMRIYCNGSTRWTIDTDSKEVYIENAGGVEEVLGYRDSVSNLKISDVKYSPQSSSSVFDFDISTLDSSWVITDLR